MYMYVLCVCACVCVVCVECCVCACVRSTVLVYVCICVFNFSECYQVGLNSPSIIKLDLSSKKSYVSVENMCMHMCALGTCMCEFVHVIALLVMQSQRVYGFVPRK